jgi:hypothetical protein
MSVEMAFEFIAHTIKGHPISCIVDNTIPREATLVGVAVEPDRQVIIFVFEHEDFPIVAEHTPVPKVTPSITLWLCTCADCEPCKMYREDSDARLR